MANKRKRQFLLEQEQIKLERIEKAFKESKNKEKELPKINFGWGKNAEEKARKEFSKIFYALSDRKSRLAGYTPLMDSIKRLVKLHDFFIRDINDLELKGKSPTKHFLQLVDHLLVKYPVPTFWNNVWDSKKFGDEWCFWFVEVAQGESVFKTCPLEITKKQAHRFMQTPAKFHPAEALRIIQFLDMGGDMAGAQGVLSCPQVMDHIFTKGTNRLNGRVRSDQEFNVELMRWFAQQNMLDIAKYRDITDWLYHKKFNAPEDERQPNLRMKGRTVEAVLREVERWHYILNRYRPLRRQDLSKIVWKNSSIGDWIFEEQKKGKENRVWCIQEITCAKELVEEGRAMSHCVGSYVRSCQEGSKSIFTMRDMGERALTIEIWGGCIRQAKGKRNRNPTPKEMQILERFASEKKIVISDWIGRRGW